MKIPSLLTQSQWGLSLLTQGQWEPSLLTQGQWGPSLQTQGQWELSLLTQGQWEPCLLTQGQWELALLTQGQWELALLTQGQWDPSLLTQGQWEGEMYAVDLIQHGGVIEEIGVWLATKLGEGIKSEYISKIAWTLSRNRLNMRSIDMGLTGWRLGLHCVSHDWQVM